MTLRRLLVALCAAFGLLSGGLEAGNSATGSHRQTGWLVFERTTRSGAASQLFVYLLEGDRGRERVFSTRQLTHSSRGAFHPASDGGGAVMFDRPPSRGSRHELFVLSPIGARMKGRPIETTCLSPCLREHSPSAARVLVQGARRAAFLAAYGPVHGHVADRVELVTVRRNGMGRHVLATWSWRRDGAEPRFTPAWSPDGKQIAFTLARRRGTSTLFVIDAGGGGLRRLTAPTLDRRAPARPAWGPNGTIAFDMKRSDGVRELYLIRSDGTDLRRLTHSRGRSGA